MTEDRTQEQDFNRMWSELQKPVQELKQQIANLSRQTARSEVAGAFEVVSALPSAGKAGRVLYLNSDDKPYYDNGSDWISFSILPKRAEMWHMDSNIVSGNGLTHSVYSTQLFNTASFQGSPSDGDSFTHSCVLAAGTYTLYLLGRSGADRGIIDWAINGSTVASGQDWYSAGTTDNVQKTVTNLSIPAGLVALKGTINGKNASSSNYYMPLTRMVLKQASD